MGVNVGTDTAMSSEVRSSRICDLKTHPDNYRMHPDNQLDHIESSITEHGFFRPVVISSDGFILAGHGVVMAAERMGLSEVPVVMVSVAHDTKQAISILTGDNEIAKLAIVDDRKLTELLKAIADHGDTLSGTGMNTEQLAALAMVTRPAREIQGHDAAREWAGMPSFAPMSKPAQVIISFENEDDRQRFSELIEVPITDRTVGVWWPYRPRDDLKNVKIVSDGQT